MTERLDIVMYGANGNALSMAQELCLGKAPDFACEIAAFIDDFEGGTGVRRWDRPLITFDIWRRDYPDVPCLLTMGSSRARRLLRDRIETAGGTFASVHSASQISPSGSVRIGPGCYLGRFIGLGRAVSIGAHVHICPLCSIGNDVSIGDFSTVFPSATIADHVILQESVFVGAGATILGGSAGQSVVIGAGAQIWAGSVVTRSVAPWATVAGNPAAPLRDLARDRQGRGVTRSRAASTDPSR